MKRSICILIVTLLTLSCGSKIDKLPFSEFEIKDENGITGIAIDETGIIRVNEEVIGKISREGKLYDKDEKLLAKITDENIVQDKNGNNLIKIDSKGRMDNGSGIFIQWSENGELMKGDEKTGMNISPVNQKSFQTASIIIFLYLNFK